MKTSFRKLPFAFFLIGLLSFQALAQVPSGRNCDQLNIMLEEGQNWFDEYTGDEIWTDMMGSGYEYNFSLWNSEAGEMIMDNDDYMWVDFFYPSSYDYDVVLEQYNSMNNSIRECLGEQYFISADQSDYAILYTEYTDTRDRENDGFLTHTQVTISLDQRDDYYFVCITIVGTEE